ncbi:MAG: hypothetical protein E6R03_09225 [Hyphomicrobiaceae bacterium]|nr:MAG: hypothetical protein E6R03_09225 [Hyphomicrobiaceae bacterium]
MILKDPIITQPLAGANGDGTTHINAAVTTTDATVTVIASIPVAQLEGCTVEALVTGFKSDFTAGIFRHLACGFRRASAGNVTAIGAASGADVEDSAGTPAVTIAANTTAQTVELRVTGIVAETYKWEAHISYTKVR